MDMLYVSLMWKHYVFLRGDTLYVLKFFKILNINSVLVYKIIGRMV
jgi:hypothetical protein